MSNPTDDDIGRLLYAVENATRRRWPFPHCLMSDVLDPALVAEMRGLDLVPHMQRLSDSRGTPISQHRFSIPILPDGPALGSAVVDRVKAIFDSPDITKALMQRFADVIQRRPQLPGNTVLLRRTLDLIEDRTGTAPISRASRQCRTGRARPSSSLRR